MGKFHYLSNWRFHFAILPSILIHMRHWSKSSKIAFILLPMLILFACSGGGYSPTYASAEIAAGDLAYRTSAIEMNSRAAGLDYDSSYADAPQEAPSQQLSSTDIEQSRKLVKQADLRIRVDNLAETENPLAELMAKYNAWPASTGIYENSRSYNIRVPSSSFDAMLAELAGFGRVLRRNEYADDVTLRYYDLESRLATRRELLRTYQAYLGRAANIEEIMAVESRIADLQQEIDWTGTQLRNLASLVDYSTIDLRLEGPAGAPSSSRPSFGERLLGLFGSFGDVASSVLVVLIGIVIYGVQAILILFLLFWLLFGKVGLLRRMWRLAAGKARPE